MAESVRLRVTAGIDDLVEIGRFVECAAIQPQSLTCYWL
jgi:hypothetical protein